LLFDVEFGIVQFLIAKENQFLQKIGLSFSQ